MYRFLLIILLSAASNLIYAQQASWFIGEWKGGPLKHEKTYTRQLQATLYITFVSENNFEGTVKVVVLTDTSIQLISKVAGYFNHNSLVATLGESIYKKDPPHGKWDLRCNKCGPITFDYSIQQGRLVLTGVTKGCDQCNGISMYSRSLDEFDPVVKASLDTLINNRKEFAKVELTPPTVIPPPIPQPDTTTIHTQTISQDTVKQEPQIPFTKQADTLVEKKEIIANTIVKPVAAAPPDTLPIARRTNINGQITDVSTPQILNNKPSPKPLPAAKPQEEFEKRNMNFMQTFVVSTDSVTLKLYDNGIVDGDIVSVFLNDNVVVNRLTLDSKAFEIKIALDKNSDNKIVLYAHNLGTISPNTSLLQIYSGKTMYSLTISSDLQTSSGIILKYQKN